MELEEIAQGLEGFQPFPGRGQILRLPRNVRVLDDSYNANPDSLGATLTAFAEMKGKNRGLVVLGDMLELGPGSARIHEEAGRQLGAMKLGLLVFLGEQAKFCALGAQAAGAREPQIHLAQTHEQVLRALGRVIEGGDWILIKGSRRMRMERIVEGLKKQLGGI
jgi:UDP-N-acetylmuramoyl-tripeptide--D-alanyl-D-alanine ligase